MNDFQKIVLPSPTPSQERFLDDRKAFVLYHAPFPTTSRIEALVAAALENTHLPHYRGLIMTAERWQMLTALDLVKKLDGVKVEHGGSAVFPNGARLHFDYAYDDDGNRGVWFDSDRLLSHGGAEYGYIAIDSAERFTKGAYSYLLSRARMIRGTYPTQAKVRLAAGMTTPEHIGYSWLRAEFFNVPLGSREAQTHAVILATQDEPKKLPWKSDEAAALYAGVRTINEVRASYLNTKDNGSDPQPVEG